MRRIVFSMGLLFLVGCSPKLNVETPFTVDPGGDSYKFVTVEAAKAAQKVSFNVSADGPVDAYVFLEKHHKTIESDVNLKKTEKILAQKESADNFTLTAEIPAREEATIWIKPSTAKKTSGKVKITN